MQNHELGHMMFLTCKTEQHMSTLPARVLLRREESRSTHLTEMSIPLFTISLVSQLDRLVGSSEVRHSTSTAPWQTPSILIRYESKGSVSTNPTQVVNDSLHTSFFVALTEDTVESLLLPHPVATVLFEQHWPTPLIYNRSERKRSGFTQRAKENNSRHTN